MRKPIRTHVRAARQGAAAFLLILVLAGASPRAANLTKSYEETAARLLAKGLQEQGAYATLKKILSVGPRLTGSSQAEAAVKLMVSHMRELGFENVRAEPTAVGRWERGPKETAKIISSRTGDVPVSLCAFGGSIATPAAGLTAGVIEVGSIEELRKAGDRAKGKIVFFNKRMNPAYGDPFRSYGEVAGLRYTGAVEAARAGAIASILRSLTFENDDGPHTGGMAYDPVVAPVPAAAISTRGADRLSGILRSDPQARFFFKMSCRTLPGVVSHNVLGEIRGTEKPDEIILLGGHLDSWDLSPGAHDDGAGCAHSIEALRLIRELKLKPKRTIRAVLFMDEENGGTGGRDYAGSKNRAKETHLAAIESDRGGFLPLWLGAGAPGAGFEKVKAWEPLFLTLGLQGIQPGGGGVDIGPLGAFGTILMGLVPDSRRYFDVHHSPRDDLETVNPRELELGAVHMALLAYLLAQEGI